MRKFFCCNARNIARHGQRVARLGAAVLLALLTANVAMAGQQKLQVLASVKPLQLIAASLLADIADVDVLVPVSSSPHNYALKPSDIRRLNSADLVIWVGEDLELFLTKPVGRLAVPAVALLDEHEAHAASAASPAQPEHAGEHHHATDPHLWMSPEQALEAAEKIIAELARRYPDRQATLAAALTGFKQRLAAADRQIATRLAPVRDQGFYVFHDAYAGFTTHYGLNQLGYFTVDPGRKPGARRLSTIRQALETNQVRCVFVEPQYTAAVVRSIVAGLPVKVAALDPLGSQASVDRDGYFRFLEELADQFSLCLSAG